MVLGCGGFPAGGSLGFLGVQRGFVRRLRRSSSLGRGCLFLRRMCGLWFLWV